LIHGLQNECCTSETQRISTDLKDSKVFRKISKNKRRYKAQTSQRGITLIEVMLAISVLTIVIIGTVFFSLYTLGRIGLGKQHRAALQLTCQKMEQLKADNEIGIDIADGETSEEVSSGNLLFTRTTVVEDDGLCKEVTVTVSWSRMGKDRNISLVSLLVEK
jgi:Tfp pilus assembly protein PilV